MTKTKVYGSWITITLRTCTGCSRKSMVMLYKILYKYEVDAKDCRFFVRRSSTASISILFLNQVYLFLAREGIFISMTTVSIIKKKSKLIIKFL